MAVRRVSQPLATGHDGPAAVRARRRASRRALLRFCAAEAGRDRADDCFQETMLAALRAYEQVRDAGAIRAWLFAIAARKAIDGHRDAARAPQPVEDIEALGVRRRRRSATPPCGRGPRAARQAATSGHAALSRDLSHREIARGMGTSRGRGAAERVRGRLSAPARMSCAPPRGDLTFRAAPPSYQHEAHRKDERRTKGLDARLRDGVARRGALDARCATRSAARAGGAGLVEVAFERHDSPLGAIVLGATAAGLVRIGLPTETEDAVLDELALRVSPRVLRASPTPVERARRAARRVLRRPPPALRRPARLALDVRASGATSCA